MWRKKKKHLCTVSGNVNWYIHYGKLEVIEGPQKKIKIEVPYDPAIPFLRIYPKEMKTVTQKDTCTPMFLAALFTITNTWKQLKVSVDG